MATTKQQHDKLLGIYTLPALERRHNGNIAIGQCLAEWISATFFFSNLIFCTAAAVADLEAGGGDELKECDLGGTRT